MWRLLNKLFGWDYVLVRVCRENVICRVITTASGPAALVYGIPRLMTPDGKFIDGDYCYGWKPLTKGIADGARLASALS